MKLNKILNMIDVKTKTLPELEIKKITAKEDKITNKTLFVFFKGIKHDKSKTLNDIIKKSPSAIITDLEVDSDIKIPIIKVANARLAYAQAMYNFCEIDENKTEIYAITRTNGKTTTATMLYNIFRKGNYKCGFIGTGKILTNDIRENDEMYSMTTPDPEILYPLIKRMQTAGCEKIVMEVSSHALALSKISPLKFKCAVFTNLSEEHLDFHGDIESYYQAKRSLFLKSEKSVFNMDDTYAKRAFLECKEKTEAYGVGIFSTADAMARDIILDGFHGSKYIYRENNHIFKVTLSLCGIYNIYNSLLAIKCAMLSQISPLTIKDSLKGIKSIDGRFEIISESPIVIIDYAHTEKAMESLLKFINSIKNSEQKIITVFGCGGERDVSKRPKMAMTAEIFSDLVIVTSDNSRSESTEKIISDIIKGFTANAKFETIPNRYDAISHAIERASPYDIVVLIGKGHERYNIDSSGYHRFNEKAIIDEAIRKRGR